VSDHHLHRYLNEFDFRYNNRIAVGIDDATRTSLAIQGAKWKRLGKASRHPEPEKTPPKGLLSPALYVPQGDHRLSEQASRSGDPCSALLYLIVAKLLAVPATLASSFEPGHKGSVLFSQLNEGEQRIGHVCAPLASNVLKRARVSPHKPYCGGLSSVKSAIAGRRPRKRSPP
jgi:hypothetical protein